MSNNSLPKLIGYFDYRKFLFDWYNAKKAINKNITYRYIGMKVEIDPGYVMKVLKSQKHLNPEKLPAFAKMIELEPREIEYFDVLIQFNKSKNEERSKALFEKLLSFNSPDCLIIEKDRYEFYQNWYHTALRELVNIIDISTNYADIAKVLVPRIPTKDVKESLKLLERLEFIKRDAQGIFRQTSNFITTGNEWRSLAIRQFHREVISLANSSISSIPTAERDLSCLTMTLTDDGLLKIKDRLAEFRKELLDICSKEVDVNRVYQMNFQLFPMSKKVDTDEI